MNNNKLLKNPTNMKELALGMITYNASSILGPLIVCLAIGFTLDKIFDTKPILLISSVIVAFIITNVLILKRLKKLIKEFNQLNPNPDKDKKDKQDIKDNQDKI